MKEAEKIIEENGKKSWQTNITTFKGKDPGLKKKFNFDKDRTKPNPVKKVK